MSLQGALTDYQSYLQDDLTRMEGWEQEHYTDEDRDNMRRVRYGAVCDICRRPSTVFKEG